MWIFLEGCLTDGLKCDAVSCWACTWILVVLAIGGFTNCDSWFSPNEGLGCIKSSDSLFSVLVNFGTGVDDTLLAVVGVVTSGSVFVVVSVVVLLELDSSGTSNLNDSNLMIPLSVQLLDKWGYFSTSNGPRVGLY